MLFGQLIRTNTPMLFGVLAGATSLSTVLSISGSQIGTYGLIVNELLGIYMSTYNRDTIHTIHNTINHTINDVNNTTDIKDILPKN